MYGILLGLCLVGILKLTDGRKRTSTEASPIGDGLLVEDEIGNLGDVDGDPVHEVLKAAYLDLKRQKAGARGPWIESILDGGSEFRFTGLPDAWGRVKVVREWRRVDPSVALTAIRWTIRDLYGCRYDLSGLFKAEASLEKNVVN